ncbi:MAG: sulfite exporter TauE/SafE family protein [Desulfovibrio sp.]|nr:sulfite exporter TauE/SafE family protein [Desulfovibrio sp.]
MGVAEGLVFVAWLIGGFISGLVGVGGAMLAVPAAAFYLHMHEVILISCILNVAMDVGLVLLHWRYCQARALWAMWLGALPGSVLGLSVLIYIPDHILRLIVGFSLLVFIYWQRIIPVTQHRESSLVAAFAGFLSGVMGSAISFDGPPVAAYCLYAGWKPREVLGTLGVFFILRGLFTVFLQWKAGLYTDLIYSCAAFGIPACLIGTLLAFPLAKRMNVKTFSRLMPLILTIAAICCIVDGLVACL